MNGLVDAAQARAELQALAVDGYPVTWIAARIGFSASGLGQIRSGQRAHTSHDVAARIHALHQQYAGAPAVQHGVPGHDSSITRSIAGREHWTPITQTLSVPPPVTIEDRFRARTTATDDGHLMWNGVPDLYWHGRRHQPAHVAFRIRTGRNPIGYVLPDCGHTGCVHPDHVDDEPGRQRTRTQLRAIRGLGNRPDTCAQGHDQDVHGRLTSNGGAYCTACLTLPVGRNNPAQLHHGKGTRITGAARIAAARDIQARHKAGATLRDIAADLGRSYGYVHGLLNTIT